MPTTPAAQRALLALLALAAAGCAPTSSSAGSGPAAEVAPTTFVLRLDSVRARIEAIGFPGRSTIPSPVLTDMFGVLRLADGLTRRDVLELVERRGTLLSAPGEWPVRARLDGVPAVGDDDVVEIHLGATLRVERGPRLEGVSFAVLPGVNTSGDTDPALLAFLDLLAMEGEAERWLVPNPHFREERLAAELLSPEAAGDAASATGSGTAGVDAFLAAEDAVYLFPDRVHGNEETYARLVALLEDPRVDWLGLEMLAVDHQEALDVFLGAGEGVEGGAFERARRELLHYYAGTWNTQFGDGGAEEPSDNHYFRLLARARALGKEVRALDADLGWIAFRYGEFPLGAVTRNVIWTEALPREGRGVVFGGSAHMDPARPGSLYRTLPLLRPGLAVFEPAPGDPGAR